MQASSDPLLIVIAGPTASAKTALSLKIAECFPAEIVNCDSIAMYREFEIGTAKPSAEDRARVPHHLLDVVQPTGPISAGEYARLAREVLKEIKSRGATPIVVGGTGLYLRALLDGLFAGPERSERFREKLRRWTQEKGPNHLHAVLSRMDAEAAAKIHANDIPKLIRAIEVCMISRQKMTSLWKAGRDSLQGFQILILGLDPPRAELYERINRRAEKMFDSGLAEETRQLLEKYGEACAPLNVLGYRQAVQVIKGELSPEAAVAAVQQAHRNYAKRQMTWFRREERMIWLRGFGDDPAIQAQARKIIDIAFKDCAAAR